MSKKKGKSRLRKAIRGFIWFLIVVLVSLNLFIVLSGRFYLYKGVYYTYLSGETSPTIYDKDKFYFSTLEAPRAHQPWKLHPDRNRLKIPESDRKYMESWGTQSFLVFRGDTLIYEEYWGEHNVNTVSNSFSAAKTVVSLLVGIAVEEGHIKSIDDPVSKYLPGFSGKGKEKITIRHLLMMASGLDWEESSSNPLSENAESYYGSDLWGLINRQQVITSPGKTFNYQSGNSQILGYIVEKATGKDLVRYAAEKLWRPMGAESDAYWSLDKKNGDEKAFCCLYSTSRDFARIGKLLAHHGKWNGRQIVPESYFDEMVRNPEMKTEEGVANTRYGLHVWTFFGYKDPVYYCRGIHGQYIIAIPAQDLVIVRTGKKRAPNYEIPKEKEGDEAYLQAHAHFIGHPTDLFRYIALGKKLAGQAD
jgi:CubicO group peptidase (beta-lactamase class C family)